MASIRGHQGRIKIFRKGRDTQIVNILSAEMTQDSSFSRAFYVGQPVAEGDQSIEGWSGSMELEVKDAAVDEFIDALVNQNLSGIGVEDVTVVIDEYYANGQIASYVYFDVQAKMSKRVAGATEKQTKRLEVQASGRQRL